MFSYFKLSSGMLSWYKYLIDNSVFSHLGFWSGSFFPIWLFADHCLLVPSNDAMYDLLYAIPHIGRIIWVLETVNVSNAQKLVQSKEVQVGNDQENAQSEKKFPLQKPRWEKNKSTIRNLYREDIF